MNRLSPAPSPACKDEDMVTFEPLMPGEEKGIEEMSAIATAIVREHYDPLLGTQQNDYMLDMFQSPRAIRGQLEHGYMYWFVCSGGRRLGFTAFYPRGDCLYLSKLYLYKHERGKGYAHSMIAFISDKARELGLDAIELNVNRFNSAVGIYEKLGFKRIREEKNDIGGGYCMDDYVYRLEL